MKLHEWQAQMMAGKGFSCAFCDRFFESLGSLKKHMCPAMEKARDKNERPKTLDLHGGR